MLDHKLKELAKSTNIYPFHMPGHKRIKPGRFPDPYSIDITEIEGFDNLHHAEGVLKKEQDRAAKIYGSKQCYYLVNGSTCGVLAAISAVSKIGDKILIARNSHKSVYNACYLRQLSPVYVYPVDTRCGLQGQVSVKSIERQLNENPDVCAVVITSPTYDGVVSDVEAIAEVVHRRNLPLIVDEAHGAHFGMHGAFPENATRLGADAVVMSIHKTLPAFTQTALLHLCSDRIDAAEISRFLGMYETSSPSYVLMAGMSRCMRMLELDSTKELFDNYVAMLEDFRKSMKELAHIKVLGADDFSAREAFAYDIGKILMDTGDSGLSGPHLKKKLLHLYCIQTEMASGNYVLAMTSFADNQKGFDRLKKALQVLDERCKPIEPEEHIEPADVYREQEKCMELHLAADAPREEVSLAEAKERICASYIYLYPPGIPILVPGERITEWTLLDIEECLETGLQIEGLGPSGSIEVVKMV